MPRVFKAKVRKVGTSLGILVPKELAEQIKKAIMEAIPEITDVVFENTKESQVSGQKPEN